MNIQPTEPRDYCAHGTLEVHSVFKTIQGEGPFAGTPAIFVRLAGCNIRCPACDTDYTSRRHRREPERVLGAVNEWAGTATPRAVNLVVITGGEPFRQNLGPLVRLLVLNGYKVQIETNGLIYDPLFPFQCATIVCSPKTASISPELASRVAAFKYVLQRGFVATDGLPVSTLGNRQAGNAPVARPPAGSSAEVYVQPLDEHDEAANAANTKAAVESSMKFGYRLCLQLHKFLSLE